MLICIESFHQKALDSILPMLKDLLHQAGITFRLIQFPSAGPFGHQLRVVESGRLEFHEIPDHLLRMVDRMDIFSNPTNGLEKSPQPPPELIIMTESQYKEAMQAIEKETQHWVMEINSILPPAQKVYWLVKENDSIPQLPDFPPVKLIFINLESFEETAQQIADDFVNEVRHG